MYENIGKKIKGLAKAIFIVEAIGAIIAGICLLATDGDLILAGLLTLFCGPIVAWVSSWILYAFGELVEAARDNENNTKQILKKLNDGTIQSKPTTIENKEPPEQTTSSPNITLSHKWLCDGCGKMRSQTPCEHCGKE